MELPIVADFVTFDDWDFDVEDETKKKATPLISSLNILKDWGNGFRKLNGKKTGIKVRENVDCTPTVCKLSTDAILRLGGQNFIQSSEQKTAISSLDHPFASDLSDEDYRSVTLVEILLAAAEKVGQKQYDRANKFLSECNKLCSKTGNPVERLVYYFARALRERVDRETGKDFGQQDLQEVLRSVNSCTIAVHKMALCQVVKFSGIQAIVDCVGTSKRIHIVDLDIRIGVQWTVLMQALATHQLERLTITALVGTRSRTLVEETGKRLMTVAESFNFTFSFKIFTDFKREELEIHPDEAIAVYSQHFLSNMILQGDKLDFLMGFIKSMNPRVTVIAEVDANHNSPVFVDRFIESLFYHGAFFDMFGDCMKENESNRMTMESEVMWHGIRNIVAAEGKERTIRHVTIDLWREYLKSIGMEEMKLSNSSMYQAKMVLEKFSGGDAITLEMNGNCLVVGWKGTPLSSLSAWKFCKINTSLGAYLTL